MDMKHPKLIEMALMPAGTPTFADIIQKLDADPGLSDLRRRDLISGLRRVAKALGRQPEDTFAEPNWLRPLLSQVAPAALGLSVKGWQNAVSDARGALARIGIVKRRIRHIDDLDASWRDLWLGVLALHDHNLTAGLGRFIHFLNNLGVAPCSVTQTHADTFLEGLKAEEIAKSPENGWRNAVNAWNHAKDRVTGWPSVVLVLPKRSDTIRLPDDALPRAFLADLTDMMQRLARPDPFADEGPARALAASTIKHRISMLKRFASELIHEGVPVEDIDSVAALCAPGTAKRGLQSMLKRNGDQKAVVIQDMAVILVSCARRLGLGDQVIAKLSDWARRVALPTQRGMTRKNRDRLRVLRNEATLLRLLDLPAKLVATSRSLKPAAAALAREDAIAIATLLVCPLRIGNIAEIRTDYHLQRPGDGQVFLVFAEDEIKNERPMEFEIPTDLRRMLDKHLASRSPLLCPAGTPWLFPRRDGKGPVDTSTLSTRLKQRILKETGIVMNAHLFRHLAAMLYLDANPGAYEAVRRLLGHSSVSKTIAVYTGLETRAVFEAFGNVLKDKKGGK